MRQGSRQPTFRGQALLATVLIFAVAIALRWDVISTGVGLNPDEGEIMAAGRRAAMELWMPMSTSSANTYFPLWPTFLGSLDVLGLPMTLYSAHLLSALLAAGTLSMLWIGTARRWGWVATTALLAPGGWALLANTIDFKQLSTEWPPVFLLVLTALIAFPRGTVVSARRLALATAFASLAPWFKPQSGPLAVAVVVAACIFAWLSADDGWTGREWWRRAAWLCVGGLGPSVFLVGLMMLGGTFGVFVEEPVGFISAYLTSSVGGIGVGTDTASIGTKAAAVTTSILSQLFTLLWVGVGARGVFLMRGGATRRTLAGLAVWALPLGATLLTLLVQWPIFPHYLLFLYAGTAIAALAGSALPSGEQAAGRDELLVPLFRDAVARRIALVTVLASLALLTAIRPGLEIDRQFARDEAVSALCAPGTSVFIWGWVPEFYAHYDWQPASRYVTYGMMRARTPNQQDYRTRFFEEMRTAPPDCIINASGADWFHPENTAVADLEGELPAISPMLGRCYERHDSGVDTGTELVVWTRLAAC